MDARTFGATIARIRRQRKMTQAALAKKLKVSHKTISKWETGRGFPDIVLLPEISSVLEVSIDYMMLGEEHISK